RPRRTFVPRRAAGRDASWAGDGFRRVRQAAIASVGRGGLQHRLARAAYPVQVSCCFWQGLGKSAFQEARRLNIAATVESATCPAPGPRSHRVDRPNQPSSFLAYQWFATAALNLTPFSGVAGATLWKP